MVSQTTSVGEATWSSTPFWSSGSMLPRKTNFAARSAARNLGLKGRKDAETRLQRLSALQVVGVLALPAEALAGCAFHAGPVDATRRQAIELRHRVVIADHPHHVDPVQERPGHAEIDGRSAQRVGGLAERGDGSSRGPRCQPPAESSDHIRSGAVRPRRVRPLARTIRVARASARRARSTSGGSPSTRHLWYQPWVRRASSSR